MDQLELIASSILPIYTAQVTLQLPTSEHQVIFSRLKATSPTWDTNGWRRVKFKARGKCYVKFTLQRKQAPKFPFTWPQKMIFNLYDENISTLWKGQQTQMATEINLAALPTWTFQEKQEKNSTHSLIQDLVLMYTRKTQDMQRVQVNVAVGNVVFTFPGFCSFN